MKSVKLILGDSVTVSPVPIGRITSSATGLEVWVADQDVTIPMPQDAANALIEQYLRFLQTDEPVMVIGE